MIPLGTSLLILRKVVAAASFAMLALPAWALEVSGFQVVGGDEALRADLRAASLLVALVQDDPSVPGIQALAAANADYGRLLRVLYAQGHFGAVIEIRLDGQEAAEISAFSVPASPRRVRYVIRPGRPYRFGAAAIAPLARGTEMPPEFATGALARGPVLQDALDEALRAWRQAGHAKVAVAGQSVVANHASRQLDASFRLDPGRVVAFGDLQQASESAVRARRVQQIAGLPTGAQFSPETLEQVSERLRRTGAFASVAVREAEALDADGQMNIVVELQDAKPRKLGFGAELSSFEGVRLSGYWMHRNFLGGAERLRFDAEISGIGGQSGGIDYDLAAHLERPAVFGPDTSIFTFVNLSYEDEPAFEQLQGDIGIGFARIFNKRVEGDVSAKLQFSEITDAFGTRSFRQFALPANLEWDNRNSALAPSTGAFATLGVTPFVNLDGSGGGANVNLDLRGYRTLDQDGRVVVAGRAQAGATFGPSLANIPGEYLYYSGGGGTVRGQPYQSLGLAQGGGAQSGGAAYLGASAEVRLALERGFGLVGFVDAGFIGDHPFGGGTGDWHAGAGLGLRYDTGIGPIRVDVAAPVAGKTGQGVQLYIGIGQAF